MVFEEVDFVDVEEAAVGAGEEAGLEGFFAAGEGALEVEGADDAVFGGAEREVDDGDFCLFLAGAGFGAAFFAPGGWGGRVAVEAAAGDDAHGGQQGGERADGGRFAGAAVAEREDAADAGVDGGDQEGALHLFLAGDGGEREAFTHWQSTLVNFH